MSTSGQPLEVREDAFRREILSAVDILLESPDPPGVAVALLLTDGLAVLAGLAGTNIHELLRQQKYFSPSYRQYAPIIGELRNKLHHHLNLSIPAAEIVLDAPGHLHAKPDGTLCICLRQLRDDLATAARALFAEKDASPPGRAATESKPPFGVSSDPWNSSTT